MIRLVKFRGKENGEWIYGGIFSPEYDKVFIITDDGKQHKVDRGTVGEFTGQKDPNGVEIYEGDVVFCNTFRGVVMYNSYTASFQVVGVRGWATSLEYDKHNLFEVAGNIFDDPELKERFWAVWNQENNEKRNE